MAFTTTTGAGGTSLIGTNGIDTAQLSTTAFASNVYVAAEGANDNISVLAAVGSATGYNVFSAAGDDTINFAVALGNSQVKAGEGNDIVTLLGSNSSTVSGLDGVDSINIGGAAAGGTTYQGSLINGNSGNDVIASSAAVTISSSTVAGGQGQDAITFANAVTIVSGRINGQDGDDNLNVLLAANMSNATLNGGQGSDTINITNNTGNAAFFSGVASGDDGNDNITGGDARDTIFGGDGSDVIAGGVDSVGDSLSGGAGVDTFGTGAANPDNSASLAGGDIAAGAANSVAAGAQFTFGGAAVVSGSNLRANSVDVITDFSAGLGGDVLNMTSTVFRNNVIANADGLFLPAVATTFAISGTWNATTGIFTAAANNTAGPDTLVIAGSAAGLDGGGSANGSEAYILAGVNASSLVAANII